MALSAKTRLGLHGGPRLAYLAFQAKAAGTSKGNAAGTRRGLHGGPRARYSFFTIDAKVEVALAWTTASKTWQDGDIYYVNWGGRADASDLSDTVIIDMDTLTMASGVTPSSCQILALRAAAGGVTATLEFDATTDDYIMTIPDGCVINWLAELHADEQKNLFDDPKSLGTTGDVVVTTTGGAVGDGLEIFLKVLLKA